MIRCVEMVHIPDEPRQSDKYVWVREPGLMPRGWCHRDDDDFDSSYEGQWHREGSC